MHPAILIFDSGIFSPRELWGLVCEAEKFTERRQTTSKLKKTVSLCPRGHQDLIFSPLAFLNKKNTLSQKFNLENVYFEFMRRAYMWDAYLFNNVKRVLKRLNELSSTSDKCLTVVDKS